MKTKQVIIALCLIAGFGLLVFFWQKTKVEQPVTKTQPTQPTPATNINSAEVPSGTPAPPLELGNITVGNAQTPTDAYKMLYAAVKAKNTEAIKRMMSQKTLAFAPAAAAQNGTEITKFYENGLTATTFAPNLPRSRDERVKDNMGAVEVWNEKENRWEDLPFVKEADGWKLAVGDIFAGSYKSPAKGQAQIEAEAMMNNAVPEVTNTNAAPPAKPAKP
jgi:hypothetical protein